MSTAAGPPTDTRPGIPELTALGRQLEMLRLDRGLSKQGLARHAGTSRQQLWRVMTGKSELTSSLCQRLAEVLGIDARTLRNPEAFARAVIDAAERTKDEPGTPTQRLAHHRGPWNGAAAPGIADYLADPGNVVRTLATYPGGDEGRSLKRAFLDDLEDCAARAGVKLGGGFFTVRGRVVNGEL